MLGGIFRMSFVAAVMFIIIGGLLIFIDGKVVCIACNATIFTIIGVIFPDFRCAWSYRQFRLGGDTG